MDAVLRGASVYFVLLIIAETTQQALLGEDFSITNSALLIITLIVIDLGLALWKQRSKKLAQLIDVLPVIVVDNGKVLHDRLGKSQVDESDILTAARESQGLERMDQINYTVLEHSGGISIIPKRQQQG